MTETYNTSGVPVDYQDGMAQKMTELRGTFDAAKADWNKLFGEAPKSIDDIDVIGFHDKKTGKEREFVPIDRVLEIIEKASDENRNHVGVVQNDDMDEAYSIIWERVHALKGERE